jgi:DNA-binding beta-propeller fold protein YncE
VLDSQTGKVLATPAIGKRPDGAEFDATAGLAMAPSGDGTLTVIGPTIKDQFGVVQTLPTQRGSRTLALDPKTRLVYLPAAEFEEAKAGDRPKMKPGTFKILVLGPAK